MDTHAHELFNIIDEAADGLTVPELKAEADKRLGAGATFTTCSGQSFTFDEIVDFFHTAGKVVTVAGRMTLNRGTICSD